MGPRQRREADCDRQGPGERREAIPGAAFPAAISEMRRAFEHVCRCESVLDQPPGVDRSQRRIDDSNEGRSEFVEELISVRAASDQTRLRARYTTSNFLSSELTTWSASSLAHSARVDP